MNYRLITLALCFVGGSAWAEQCLAPKPFIKLASEQASQYQFDAIMEKTTAMSFSNSHQKTAQEPISQKPQTKVMNFWATWCKPCRAELPLLDQLKAANAADIYLVNIGDSEKSVKRLVSEIKIDYADIRHSKDDLLSELSLVGLPATFVWANRQTVFRGMGKLHDKQAIKTWLNCLEKQFDTN